MFISIRRRSYSETKCPTFFELTREFYVTFEFDLLKEFSVTTRNVIRFRLMEQEFQLFISKFNLVLGFIDMEYVESRKYTESACDFVKPFFSFHTEIW